MSNRFIGYVEAETPKAFFFQDHLWHEPVWVPKSQIETIVRFDFTHEIVVDLSPWICGKNQLEEFTERLPAEDGEICCADAGL